MPAQQTQFLYPQRPGEQVPDSQIITQGPFSRELTEPAFRAPQVKEPGFGGTGHALLSFVNNFLAGASQGRLRQFQQSELTKKEHERNFDATVQHILDSPQFTRDFKEKVMQDALATKASAGLAGLGGGKGGKNDHPLVGLARNVFSGIVGPSENVKHVDIGPDHVAGLISQMHDPGNIFSLPDELEKAKAEASTAVNDARLRAATLNTPFYAEDARGLPAVSQAFDKINRQGINHRVLPGVDEMFAALPSRPTPAMLEDMALRAKQSKVADVQLANAQNKTALASTNYEFTLPDGTKRIQALRNVDGKLVNLAGEPIPSELMRTARLVPAAEITGAMPRYTAGTRLVQQLDGTIAEVPNLTITGRGTPPPPAAGAPQATQSPSGVSIPAVAPGQPGVQQLAFKNNNPGNLEFAGQSGAILGDDGRFAKFETPEAGFSALIGQIGLDAGRGLTLEGYVNKFAPAGGKDNNNPALYAANMAKALGVDPKTPLSQIDPQKLAQAQVQQESSTKVGTSPGPTSLPPGARIVGGKPVASPIVAVPRNLTPEEGVKLRKEAAESKDLDLDAWRYGLEGKLVTRGRGKEAEAESRKIKQRFGQIMDDLGLDSGEVMSRGAELKGGIQAYSKLSTQAAMMGSFEGTLLRNAELAKTLSSAFQRSDLPFLNKVISAFKTGTGDAEAKNLAAQLHGLSREWAKIMAGSVSAMGVPISEAKQTDEIIAKGISEGQLSSLIDNVIVPDAKNRRAAFEEEKKNLRDTIKATTGAAATPSATPNPPAKNKWGYVPGGVYGNKIYIDGDPSLGASWKDK